MTQNGSTGTPGNGAADKPKLKMTHTPLHLPPTPAQICMLLGSVAVLMSNSAVHRHLFIADLEWLVMPPIRLGQCRLYHDEQKPLAYVSWAFINDAVDARIKAGVPRLQPQEWKSGDKPWIMETVAPFGGFDEIVKDLTATVFGGVRPNVVGEG